MRVKSKQLEQKVHNYIRIKPQHLCEKSQWFTRVKDGKKS